MPDDFQYDVFLSHSSKDERSKPPTMLHDTGGNAVVRPLAKRLRADGVKVWFDEWPEGSRVLALCMSANAFGSDWAQLESGTLRTGRRPFRDPLNEERRFLPLRLDDASTNHSDWLRKDYMRWQFANRTQSHTLATLRNTLLPKLLGGVECGGSLLI